MTTARHDLLRRIGATAALVVFTFGLAALVPIGEAAWIENLTVSGELSTDWTEPPAPAQLAISETSISCDAEPALMMTLTNSGEEAAGETVVEAWVAPGTDDGFLTGTALAAAIQPGQSVALRITAAAGAIHLLAVTHGSADTVWSEPIVVPADICAVTESADPATTTTAATTTTSSSPTTTSTTEASTTTTEGTTTTTSSTTSSSSTTSTSTSTSSSTTTSTSSSSTTSTTATAPTSTTSSSTSSTTSTTSTSSTSSTTSTTSTSSTTTSSTSSTTTTTLSG